MINDIHNMNWTHLQTPYYLRGMKTYLPGIFIVLLLSALAMVASTFIRGLNTVCLAILVGVVWGNVFGRHSAPAAGMQCTEKHILPIAIALMGLELNLPALKELGPVAPLVVLPAMTLSILTAWGVGRLLKIPPRTALLLGIGNSVCGSSAILAVEPVLKPGKQECALAIAAVNLMGTLGLFILPHLAALLHFNEIKSAYLIGGGLQAVGQVVASGLSISTTIGHQALVIKMMRVLMIGPIVMILMLSFGRKKSDPPRQLIPGYIIGFAVCSLIGSLFQSDTLLLSGLQNLGTGLMVMAMVAIGSKIRIRSLIQQGGKALILTTCSSLALISTLVLLSTILIK